MTTTAIRDIETMTSKQLVKLQAEISAALVRRHDQAVENGKANEIRARDEMRAQLAELADKLGSQVAKVFPKTARATPNGHGKVKPAPKAKGLKAGKVPVKYRFGDNAWSGRGKRPKWLVERLAGGAHIEEFRVPAA